MAVAQVSIFITIVKNVYDGLKTFVDNSDKQKVRLNDAHFAINNAFIETDNFLRSAHGGYVSNPELAKSWNLAASKVMLVDKGLGDMLYYKSRFWNNPDLFIELGKDGEILELKEIIEEMEKLRMKM